MPSEDERLIPLGVDFLSHFSASRVDIIAQHGRPASMATKLLIVEDEATLRETLVYNLATLDLATPHDPASTLDVRQRRDFPPALSNHRYTPSRAPVAFGCLS